MKITNHSEQQVLLPEVEQMHGALPGVRWGYEVSAEGGEPFYLPTKVLKPEICHRVPFEYVAADGRIVDPAEAYDAFTSNCERDSAGKLHIISKITSTGKVKNWVNDDDVTITFTDTSGLRWQRTGNKEPVRIVQPAPTQPLRVRVGPFVADWISRIRRYVPWR
ncbi:MAG: hypothetical protein ACRDTH_26250 [Pseudonocardiaceae bacterium]